MHIIRAPLSAPAPTADEIPLPIDRLTLAKRRWHAPAADGCEFGFDLLEPLHDGVPFFQLAGATYRIAQTPEPVLEIPLATAAESARFGWLIGNLHFSLQIAPPVIRVADDPALRQLLTREHIPFAPATSIFHPDRQAHVH